MTLAEVERFLTSRKRVQKIEQQEKAMFDYILADLMGRSISRIYNSANKMPDIATVYPALFDEEQIQETKVKKQDELSALRFKHFAESFNKKFREVAKENE